jgi:antitoxin CptB
VSGSESRGAGLAPNRRRILVRAWRRGLRELDLLFGPYADAHAGAMGEDELEEFERLMEAPDAHMLTWVMGFEPTPAEYDTPLFAKILRFRETGGATPR